MRNKKEYPVENEENLSTWGLKHPERILFDISPSVARIFRRHCAIKSYKIGKVVENLIVDYLIAQKEITDRSILDKQIEGETR